jgi:hypothetical protein
VPKAACSDAEFLALWHQFKGSSVAMQKALNIDVANVYRRRRRIEKRLGQALLCHSPQSPDAVLIGPENTYIRKNSATLTDGVIVVFTDAHIHPGVQTTAQRALLKLLPKIKPDIVVDNGDSFDGGQISRHDRIGWDRRPTVQEELQANGEFHDAVRRAAKGAKFFWNWGNHDMRYPTRLAAQVPEFMGVAGMRLEDHFPEWHFGICLTINPEDRCPLLIKHRYRGGDHADWNNTMRAGIHIGTGHDHQMGARRFADKRGVRWGMRFGTLSDADLPIFDYQEANPSQQVSGFGVLKYKNSRLMCPQFCEVIADGRVEYMGEEYEV